MTIDEAVRQLEDGELDMWEHRAQAISWAVGQLLCMRSNAGADEWSLRLWAAEAWERRQA